MDYYYDIPVAYADYSGYILYNQVARLATGVISSEVAGAATRFYVQNDIGEFNLSFKLINGNEISRVIDYKVQADSKSFYYFGNSDQWVIYHTFDEESYYGNRFYPTIGAVSCYDSNDSEIYPTDIMFYPECIKDGAFEGAKTIIKWASKQSGKVCFNSGFSNNESQDQSRIILPVSRYGWSENENNRIECTVTRPIDMRSTGKNIIEPFMTVDAIDNGNIVEYKLVHHSLEPLGESRKLEYGNIKIRADRRFFNSLDAKLNNNTEVNTDILNVITVASNTLSEIVNISYGYGVLFLNGGSGGVSGMQNTQYVSYGEGKRYLLKTKIPGTVYGYDSIQDEYPVNRMIIDNIGYIYDENAPYKYQLKFYVHGVMDGTEWEFDETALGSVSLYDRIKYVERYEKFRPLVKIPGVDGYLKIVAKSKTYKIQQVDGGKFEAEYVLEFPCAPGSALIRGAGMDYAVTYGMTNLFESDDDYKSCQIYYPQSIVNASGLGRQYNERESFDLDDSFTTVALVESDFTTKAFRRNATGKEDLNDTNKSILYPSNSVYRNLVPNKLDSISTGYLIEVLKGINDGDSVLPNRDMKLFVLNRNDKWHYDKSKFESVSGRENPSYIFEIDATTMLADYSDKFKDNPTLPDIKRWFTAYCRGFAYMSNDSYTQKKPKSESEMVLDIWDLTTGNWRSVTPGANDDGAIVGDIFINEYRTFKFGAQNVYNGARIDKYFDLKGGDAASRYIDENNKIYCRARIMRHRTYPIKKDTADDDAFANGDPWSLGTVNPTSIGRDENISVFGIDYFRMNTL